MKKIASYIIFLALTVPNLIFSQNFSGAVTYKYKGNDSFLNKTNNSKDERLKKVMSSINKSIQSGADVIEFTLTFNKNESLYEMKEILYNDFDKNKLKYAVIFAGGTHVIYTNLAERKRYSKVEDFIIKEDLDSIKWNISNEKKQIGKYLCYKATTIKRIRNSKGLFETLVIAWFTPQIPVSFGPKEYAGLPGLIVHLDEGKLQYCAKNIKLNPTKKISIKRPNKGKVVTKKEFNDFYSNFYQRKK